MIEKMSSNELNKILEDANEQILKTGARVEEIKDDIETKLKVITYENRYVQSIMEKIRLGGYAKADFIPLAGIKSSRVSEFGSTVHARQIREAINVFNISTSSMNKIYFREDVKVSVNDVESDEYTSILKHDTIPKGIFFNEYEHDVITLKIELSELSMILGPTKFNIIEIDPFLSGSFDISDIRVYEFTSTGGVSENSVPVSLGRYENIGPQRIVIPEKLSFYKIEIDINAKFETWKNGSKIYPFGIRHLYFYDMDLDPSSYVIAEIKSDEYISYIRNEIKIKGVSKEIESTIKEMEIELYLDMDKTTFKLSTPIEESTSDNIKEISKNVKVIYAKIPITTSDSIIGIEFYPENRIK